MYFVEEKVIDRVLHFRISSTDKFSPYTAEQLTILLQNEKDKNTKLSEIFQAVKERLSQHHDIF